MKAMTMCFVMLVFAFAPAALSQDAVHPITANGPVNGLEMSISLGPQTSPFVSTVMLHLRNVGTAKLTVDLGGLCGAPARLNSVEFRLTSSSGTHVQLKDAGPGAWTCAGGLSILRVPIEPGADYWTSIDLYYYRQFPLTLSPCGDDYARGWKPGGTYMLRAELSVTPSENENSFFAGDWRGTIVSNDIQIHFLG